MNEKSTEELIEELDRMMTENRQKYGTHWVQVRIDRLAHCFDPFLSIQQLKDMVKMAVEKQWVVMTQKITSEEVVPAIELIL